MRNNARKEVYRVGCVLAIVWSCVPVCGLEPSPQTPEGSIAQPLSYLSAHDLALSGANAFGLVSSAQAETFLIHLPLSQDAKPREMKLRENYDGLHVTDEELLIWIYSKGDAGRLALVDPPRSEIPIWKGPVLNLGRPRVTGRRIWWITRLVEAPRVAYIDVVPKMKGSQEPSYAPNLPESATVSTFFFAQEHAVAVDDEQGSDVWFWTKGEESWKKVPSPSSSVVGTTESRLLALDATRSELLAWDLRLQESTWSSIYQSLPGTQIELGEMYSSHSQSSVSFSERDRTGRIRFLVMHQTPSGFSEPSIAEPHISNPEFWEWNGNAWLTIRRQDSRYQLSGQVMPSNSEERQASRISTSPIPAGVLNAHRVPDIEPSASSIARRRAEEWLRAQLGPKFQTAQGKGRLIDSYEDNIAAGWTYDAALASIAFTASKEHQLAKELLRGLQRLQEDDGSWVFSYDPGRARPLGEKKYVGAMAWVIMAANFYEWHSADPSFAGMARRGLAYLLSFRQDSREHGAFGAISMGPANPQAYSVEHNLNCYSAFLWRGRLDKNPSYLRTAGQIQAFILNAQWNKPATESEFAYFKVGYRDNDFYLDAQSWAVLAFWKEGTSDHRFETALASAVKLLEVRTGQHGDHSDIVGFNEALGPTISEKVWAEGTEGVVASLLVLGKNDSAAHYHAQTERYQSTSGGIPYATENSDSWPIIPAVASTAWFLLNELKPWHNPFQPGSRLLDGLPPKEVKQHLSN